MTVSLESLLAWGGALAAVVVWLVRLEAATKRNAERLDDFKVECKDDFKGIRDDVREFRGGPMHIDRLPK